MMVKKVIITVKVPSPIENNLGIAQIKEVIPTNEIPIAKPLTRLIGIQSVTRFKKPVYVKIKTHSDLYSTPDNTTVDCV